MTDVNPFGNAAEAEPQARKSKRWIWIAGIGCAVLFVPCLGLVATIVVPALLTRFPEAQRKKAEIDLQQIATAVSAFDSFNGSLPESLELLVTPDAAGKTFLKGYTSVPHDPWGRPYTYEPREGGAFRLASLGPDGVVSGDDVEHRVVNAVIEER
jgi:general secretion pathway protein G